MPAGPGEGILVIDRPWPSMMRTLRGDHERFEKTYFPTGEGFAGKYFTGKSSCSFTALTPRCSCQER